MLRHVARNPPLQNPPTNFHKFRGLEILIVVGVRIFRLFAKVNDRFRYAQKTMRNANLAFLSSWGAFFFKF